MSDELKKMIGVAIKAPTFDLFKITLLSFNLSNKQLQEIWDLKKLDFDKKECSQCFGKFHKNLVAEVKGKLTCLDCAVKPLRKIKENRVIKPFNGSGDIEKVISQLSGLKGFEVVSVNDYNEACNKIINGIITEQNKYFQQFKLRSDNSNFSPDIDLVRLESWFKSNYNMPFKLEMFEQAIKEYCEREQMTYLKENNKFSFIPF